MTGVTGGSGQAGLDALEAARGRCDPRALDRLLLWNWYMVPNWYSQNIHIAYWDRFGDPGIPIRDGFYFDSWWIDQQTAAHDDEQYVGTTPATISSEHDDETDD